MAASRSQLQQSGATHASVRAQLRSVNLELQRRGQERESVLQTIRGLMIEHSLSVSDILNYVRPISRRPSAKPKRSSSISAQNPAMYMVPVSGKTWSGRGHCPKWLVGKLDRYRVGGF